jgi:hypothetical protein
VIQYLAKLRFSRTFTPQGRPQAVLEVPKSNTAIVILFQRHILVRDFAVPSWVPDGRGSWTVVLPGAPMSRNHSGYISTVDGSKLEALLHREVVRARCDLPINVLLIVELLWATIGARALQQAQHFVSFLPYSPLNIRGL